MYKKLMVTAFATLMISLGSANADVVQPQMKYGVLLDQSDDKQEVVQPQMKFYAIFCSPQSGEDQAPKNMMYHIIIL